MAVDSCWKMMIAYCVWKHVVNQHTGLQVVQVRAPQMKLGPVT